MSDTWSMECRECHHRIDTFNPKVERNADGKTATAICAKCKKRVPATYKRVGCMFLIADPCPTCHGKPIELEVAVPAEHKGGTGYYRPMTVAEVEWLIENVIPDGPNWYELLLKGRLEVTYKGAKVRLKGG